MNRRRIIAGCSLVLLLGLVLETTAAQARVREPGFIHCTRKGDTPKKIARYYGAPLKWLIKASGNVQRLMAENRKIRAVNRRLKTRAQDRLKRQLKAWKRGGRKGKRPRLQFKPRKERRFEAMQPIRVVRATRNNEMRDAVMRLNLGASVSWVSKTYGVSEDVVRCVNQISKRRKKVRCRRKRIKGPRRRWQPKFRSSCDGGRQYLLVRIPKPKRQGRPRGLPVGGKLSHGERFPIVPGIHAKNRAHTFAASHVVTRLIDAVGIVQRSLGGTPDLVLGDISRKGGGRFPPHRSHQNGLDVDLGYYHLGEVSKDRFTKITKRNFDKVRTWALIKRLLESGEVQYIFMSTSVQKMLRPFMLARRQRDAAWCMRFIKALSHRKRYGKPRNLRAKYGMDAGWVRCVKRSFGHRGFSNALIRHAKGHDDHIHVRFFPRRGRWRRGGAP